MPIGFTGKATSVQRPVGYNDLEKIFSETPGLTSDKLKAVLRAVGALITNANIKGIVFAYDEAQNMADHAGKDQFPLSLLLDVFQSVQRSPGGLPFILVLTGLPTLFPKLIEARTYSERMFHTIFLDRLSEVESKEAIKIPIKHNHSTVHFEDETVNQIVKMSGGYPYFIQFICREAFDICVSKLVAKQEPVVSPELILRKLDSDFFSARWDKVSDAQRIFLKVAAQIPNCEDEFSVSEVVACSRDILAKGYSSSSVTQFLGRLSEHGLIYRGSNGKYRFAVPLLARFIRRQMISETNLPSAFREPSG